jgi:hypothetical protein
MGCGCLLLLVGLAFPRVAIALLLLFSDWFARAFDGLLIPLLGLVFLPYTLLWYSVVINTYDGRWQILFLALALIADLSSSAGGIFRRRRSRD